MVKVSAAVVAAAFVLHTMVVPVGVVPVVARVFRLMVAVEQVLVAVVGVTEGAVVPAKQARQTVIVTSTESAGL